MTDHYVTFKKIFEKGDSLLNNGKIKQAFYSYQGSKG